jgi:hypothetical protein
VESLGEIGSFLHAQRSPEAYILSAFADHDVVLLGETHGIKHFVELVQHLIPLLPAVGVTNVGMEFGAAEDQDALDALVNAETYDEARARQLMANYHVGWAYQEYHDVYRQAWQYNRTRPPAALPFRIVNLSYRYDWRHFRTVRTPAVMQRVFARGPIERFRADVVEREIFATRQKILILTGAIHAFTKYHFPLYDDFARGFVRFCDADFGNLLEQRAPGQTWTILLHIPWESPDRSQQIRPLSGRIDAAMEAAGHPRVGFDTRSSPFSRIIDQSSYYATGYPDFTLATLADGYIYEQPFRAYEGCTLDPLFLTAAHWPRIQEQIPDPDWAERPSTLEAYWERIAGFVDMHQRLRGVRE